MMKLDPQPRTAELAEHGGLFGYQRQFMEVGMGYGTRFWDAPAGKRAVLGDGVWCWETQAITAEETV